MNAHAHLPGQISNQMSNQMSAQASTQVSGPSQQIGNYMAPQMQNLGSRPMDTELQNGRAIMLRKIYHILQRRNPTFSEEWTRKLPELVKRIEDRIFHDAATRDVYLNLAMEPAEHRLYAVIKNVLNNSRPSHHITSSSVSTMIPTPGVSNISNNSAILVQPENPTITTGNTAVAPQTTANMGNLPSTAPAPTDVGNNGSLNSLDGTTPNGYLHQSSNFGLGSGGSNIMSSMASTNVARQFSQMIPTPGFNSQQAVSANLEGFNGGFSSNESNLVPQSIQQKKYVASQNSHILHSVGAQIGAGTRSNVLHTGSSYGFTHGLANGALGLIGDSMQRTEHAASGSFQSSNLYANSPKPLQQNFSQQHHQQRVTTSFPQQVLSVVDDGYTANTNDITHSEAFSAPDSSSFSAISNMNSVLHPKSRATTGLLNHRAGLQSMQLPSNTRAQLFNQSEKTTYQPSQSIRENLLQSQQQVQLSRQQPNQNYAQLVQNQHQLLQRPQQNIQNQQLTVNNDSLIKSSVTSHFNEQLMADHVNITCSESLIQSASQQVPPSELQTQYQQNASSEGYAKSVQVLGRLNSSQDFQVSVSEGSQQLLHPQNQPDGFLNNFGSVSSGLQVEELLQFQWQSQPLQQAQLADKPSYQQLQEELHQRLTGLEEAQQPHLSARVDFVSGDSAKQREYLKQTRWLLFLHHARRCPSVKGLCKEANCVKAQELVMHMDMCKSDYCKFPRCSQSRKLIKHIRSCQATDCPVCIPVRDRIAANYKTYSRALSETDLIEMRTNADGMKSDATPSDESEGRQPGSKRMKLKLTSFCPKSETMLVSAPSGNQYYDVQEAHDPACNQTINKISGNSEVNVKMDEPCSELENVPKFCSDNDHMSLMSRQKNLSVSSSFDSVKQESLVVDNVLDHTASETKHDPGNQPMDQVTGSKSGKPKIKGVSLTELFTPEQIKEHINGLRRWVGQSKAKAEKNQAMERSMTENSCQLCAVEKLTFEPPPIYCSPCGSRIKRNALYYTVGTGETRLYFCIPCYNEARGDTIEAEGSTFPKAKLEKKRNDEETEEWWVQCDKCETWQHQICALFNGRRNDGEAEYTCPNCYVEEIKRGERKPLPQSAVLGAKDLPRTILSDHIEQRLFKRLKHERQERAKHSGKNVDEVPGAEGLVVRVVSSVDKKLEVKQRFLEIFQEENYPKEFPYKSKAVLLFQKIEGVEVCLFGMYVQEFGSECSFPNQRRVYLSYLDSVKYFRPEIKTVSGEALRTFVYHEILIGYLEYCKKRGFTSCYIWACPPLKGEDYILYCHPEIQKTPKSDKLREWYLSMLRKASRENIVVELTNLYDHFFVTMGECKAKVTAGRLPYFDGDYWPGAAEDIINQLRLEEDDRKQLKKGKTKSALTKRTLKAAGQTDLSGNISKDALLMQKLGETICAMKEDFIMVHLQHSCTYCCILMVSGKRWVCGQCKNFQLCDRCYEAEQTVDERERHPSNSREKHMLYPVEINDVAQDTKDKDEILESEFFDTRQAFLSLCQGNHYQYDTLRRAKHSSMMVLYHLHNPTAPAFVTTCNVCHHDIEAGQGWRCEICPDFDVCSACYQKGGIDHPHVLTNHPSNAERDAQNKEARANRVLQLRKMLDLLVHASQCPSPQCQYPNCRKVKRLFRHGFQCKIRASGGCVLCKRMWYLLHVHSRACKESGCSVPRCRDLKEHLRRLQQQSDSRRRAAVMEMMRQRAAEVAQST